MRFINYTDRNNILLIFLLSHSTHRLQPLNIDLFGSLTQYYIQKINRFIFEIQDLVNIIKRHF
jgi:hypothetical protein